MKKLPDATGDRYEAKFHKKTSTRVGKKTRTVDEWLTLTINPQGVTLTSGLGRVYPVAFLDLPSYVDGIAEYVPGITPYRYFPAFSREPIMRFSCRGMYPSFRPFSSSAMMAWRS